MELRSTGRQSADEQQQPLPSRARNENERKDIFEGLVTEDDHFGGRTLQYREQMTLRIREREWKEFHHDLSKIPSYLLKYIKITMAKI